MGMTNMAMTAEEAKEYGGPCVAAGDAPEGPKYPYGLQLCLNDGSLEKLGITELPKVGTELLVMAKVRVTGVRSSEQQGGDKEDTIDLQVTDMALSAPTESVDAKALYPNSSMEA